MESHGLFQHANLMDLVEGRRHNKIKFVDENFVLWLAHLYFNINRNVQCVCHSISPHRLGISMTRLTGED